MAVDYNDERFQNVKAEEQQALANANNTYNNMIAQSDQYYNDLSQAAEDWGNKQAELQQANTDFTIEKIEQQKDQAAKDYTKEQKGAYVDWQKQSNRYGGTAEQLAQAGLSKTGYAESSEVAMYTAYQNRIAQARDTYNKAVLEYDNGIKEAQLTNNSALAEISYKALQTKLSTALEGFQYKNQLLQQQMTMQNSISDRYYERWQDVLSQINTENALAEQQRQFNMTYNASYGGGSGRSGGSGGSGGSNGKYTINKNGGSSTETSVKGISDAVLKAAKNSVVANSVVNKLANNTSGLVDWYNNAGSNTNKQENKGGATKSNKNSLSRKVKPI